MLHSDDEFLPTKLEKQVSFLNQHPNVAAVFALPHIVNEQGDDYPDAAHSYWTLFNQRNRSRHEWLKQFFFQLNCLLHPSVLVRREVYQTLGSYNPLLGAADDPDMWVRVCLRHEIHVLPEVAPRQLPHARLARKCQRRQAGQRPTARVRVDQDPGSLSVPGSVAQLHLIFPEVGDQVRRRIRRRETARPGKDRPQCSRLSVASVLGNRLALPTSARILRRNGNSMVRSACRLRANSSGRLAASVRLPCTSFQSPRSSGRWLTGPTPRSTSHRCYVHNHTGGRCEFLSPPGTRPCRFGSPCNCAAVDCRISEVNVLSRADGTCLWKCDLNEGPDGVTVLAQPSCGCPDQHHLSMFRRTGTNPQILLSGIPALPNVPLELQVRINVKARSRLCPVRD